MTCDDLLRSIFRFLAFQELLAAQISATSAGWERAVVDHVREHLHHLRVEPRQRPSLFLLLRCDAVDSLDLDSASQLRLISKTRPDLAAKIRHVRLRTTISGLVLLPPLASLQILRVERLFLSPESLWEGGLRNLRELGVFVVSPSCAMDNDTRDIASALRLWPDLRVYVAVRHGTELVHRRSVAHGVSGVRDVQAQRLARLLRRLDDICAASADKATGGVKELTLPSLELFLGTESQSVAQDDVRRAVRRTLEDWTAREEVRGCVEVQARLLGRNAAFLETLELSLARCRSLREAQLRATAPLQQLRQLKLNLSSDSVASVAGSPLPPHIETMVLRVDDGVAPPEKHRSVIEGVRDLASGSQSQAEAVGLTALRYLAVRHRTGDRNSVDNYLVNGIATLLRRCPGLTVLDVESPLLSAGLAARCILDALVCPRAALRLRYSALPE